MSAQQRRPAGRGSRRRTIALLFRGIRRLVQLQRPGDGTPANDQDDGGGAGGRSRHGLPVVPLRRDHRETHLVDHPGRLLPGTGGGRRRGGLRFRYGRYRAGGTRPRGELPDGNRLRSRTKGLPVPLPFPRERNRIRNRPLGTTRPDRARDDRFGRGRKLRVFDPVHRRIRGRRRRGPGGAGGGQGTGGGHDAGRPRRRRRYRKRDKPPSGNAGGHAGSHV
mmetsp:Transcript_119758/g.244920  ORF Transcript_119758/g.244920 Transcript_119758/m.244920 type:complete len:221 (-) Transcript_119758:684-1346(-)